MRGHPIPTKKKCVCVGSAVGWCFSPLLVCPNAFVGWPFTPLLVCRNVLCDGPTNNHLLFSYYHFFITAQVPYRPLASPAYLLQMLVLLCQIFLEVFFKVGRTFCNTLNRIFCKIASLLYIVVLKPCFGCIRQNDTKVY